MKTILPLISLTTVIIGLAAPAQTQPCASAGGLAARFKQMDRNGDAKIEGDKRLLVADPGGNRIYIEQSPTDAIKAAAAIRP